MKIAFVVDYWLGSKGGGVLSFNTNLARRLESSGHYVDVLFRQGFDAKQHKLPEDKKAFAKEAQRKLESLCPDAMLCQDGWFTALPAARHADGDAVRLVVFHTHFEKRLSFFKAVAYDRILAKFDAACFVSKGLMDNVRDVARLRIKRGFALHPGIDPGSVVGADGGAFRAKHGIPPDAPLILMHAGTIYGPKARGAGMLIESLAKVRGGHPDVRLVITRDGPFSGELKSRAAAIGVSENVIFTGDLDRPLDATVAADVYAHISFGDGYPISILEAMALGKPVVASAIPGIDEAVEDGRTGLLVENSPDKVATALTRLLGDAGESRRLGDAARKFVGENRSWGNTESELMSIISDCRHLKSRGARA
jgi:glycosyltransferase involved in cell wall biosynthesis